VLLPRLQQCEQRLAGVTNLAGSLIAVDLMAAELGITVPHPPLSSLTHDSISTTSSNSSSAGSSRNSTEQAVSAAAMPQQQQGQGGVLTLSRQQQLQQQIDAAKEQMAAVQQHMQQLQQQVRCACHVRGCRGVCVWGGGKVGLAGLLHRRQHEVQPQRPLGGKPVVLGIYSCGSCSPARHALGPCVRASGWTG